MGRRRRRKYFRVRTGRFIARKRSAAIVRYWRIWCSRRDALSATAVHHPSPDSNTLQSGMASLVTGASGFLGGRVVQLLVDQGEEVTILSRANSDLRHLASLPLRVVRGDLSDPAALRDAVAGA